MLLARFNIGLIEAWMGDPERERSSDHVGAMAKKVPSLADLSLNQADIPISPTTQKRYFLEKWREQSEREIMIVQVTILVPGHDLLWNPGSTLLMGREARCLVLTRIH